MMPTIGKICGIDVTPRHLPVDLSTGWTFVDPNAAGGCSNAWTDNGDGTYTVTVDHTVAGRYFWYRAWTASVGKAKGALDGILYSGAILPASLPDVAGIRCMVGGAGAIPAAAVGTYTVAGWLSNSALLWQATSEITSAGTGGAATATDADAPAFATYPICGVLGSVGAVDGRGVLQVLLRSSAAASVPLSALATVQRAIGAYQILEISSDGTGAGNHTITISLEEQRIRIPA